MYREKRGRERERRKRRRKKRKKKERGRERENPFQVCVYYEVRKGSGYMVSPQVPGEGKYIL